MNHDLNVGKDVEKIKLSFQLIFLQETQQMSRW